MSRIRQLDAAVVNKIAAGEVIERPANVVKELLENSLDALASRIEVDIENGGSELIRIVDDGEGIDPEDLLLAVSSHATSKLVTADDLFRVQTMGFRGEALASIAEVSRVRLRSRTPDVDTGHEIEVDCGRIRPTQPCGCPVGTQIEVRQLFANTPVRRKFLKSVATEFAHVAEHFTRIALAHPRLHLVLRHNGKPVFELPSTPQTLDRIRLLFGNELADDLIAVESEASGVRMWGYAGHPSIHKSTRKSQHLFLNGRWIQDRSLQHALTEAYRGLLMTGRQPIAFLYLDVPAGEVDVNVHPTKTEVRFADGQALFRQLLSMLRTKFLSLNFESTMRLPTSPGGAGFVAAGAGLRPRSVEFQSWSPSNTSASSSLWSNSPRSPIELPRVGGHGDVPVSGIPGREALEALSAVEPVPVEPLRADAIASDHQGLGTEYSILEPPLPGEAFAPVSATGTDSFRDAAACDNAAVPGSSLRPPRESSGDDTNQQRAGSDSKARAMQIRDTYIVIETDEGLTVIDQHALHERILYEYLRPRVLSHAVESQRMLVPETVELTPKETALLLEYSEVLTQLGFGIREFGRQTVLVDRYPVMLAKANLPQLVKDLAEQLDQPDQQPNRRDLLDSLLHMMSCKAAIKAGHRLSPEEIDSLLAQRHLIDDAHHCPHGRPTALVLTENELERQFGRLG